MRALTALARALACTDSQVLTLLALLVQSTNTDAVSARVCTDSQWIAWVSVREGPRSCARRCTAHSQVRSLLALLVQKVREGPRSCARRCTAHSQVLPSTQFTCFTSTTVQILTQKAHASDAGTQFTCFTGTKAQILTHKAPTEREG